MSEGHGIQEFKLMVQMGVEQLNLSSAARKAMEAEEMMNGTTKDMLVDATTSSESESDSDDEFCQCEDLLLQEGAFKVTKNSRTSVIRTPQQQNGHKNNSAKKGHGVVSQNHKEHPKKTTTHKTAKNTLLHDAMFTKTEHGKTTHVQPQPHEKKHVSDAHHKIALAIKAVEHAASKPVIINKVTVKAVIPRKLISSTGEKSVCTTESKSHAIDFYDFLMQTSTMVTQQYEGQVKNETRDVLIQAILNHGLVSHDKMRSKIATDYFQQIQNMRTALEMANIDNKDESACV
jgi:hypothetical protein